MVSVPRMYLSDALPPALWRLDTQSDALTLGSAKVALALWMRAARAKSETDFRGTYALGLRQIQQ
jgi:hypothetical protein